MPSIRRHVPEIDGLRGLAIFGVIFHHQFSVPLGALNPHVLGISLRPLTDNGWLGVNLFFLLSGFVLFLPYALGHRSMATAADRRAFWVHRAKRLLPLYYFVVLVLMALTGRQPFETPEASRETIGLLTFTFPFMPHHFSPSVNWALWSIGVEVLFSALFPLVCAACLKWGPGRLLLVCVPVSMGARILGHILTPAPLITWIGDGLLIGRLDEFLWGCLCAELYSRGRFKVRPQVLLLLSLVLTAPTLVGFSAAVQHKLPTVAMAPLATVLDLGMSLLVLAVVNYPEAIAATALRLRPLRVAGMACYSLYLWHMPMLSALRLHIDSWDLPKLAFFTVAVLTVSGFTYRFIEFGGVADWRSLFLLPRPAARSNPAGHSRDSEDQAETPLVPSA